MRTGPEMPLSENGIVRWLEKRFPGSPRGVRLGIGDDAAVIHPGGADEYWVVTTDMLVEGVDFRPGWLRPRELGHKSLAVNLSDLAAMGARPRFYLVALALPTDVTEKWVEDFYRGMARLGERHAAALLGGDLSRSPSGLQITVTAVGESRNRRFLRRSGGRPGDFLYVTGMLGRAAAGLELLRRGITVGRSRAERSALEAHRMPEPRCAAGEWLAASGLVRCMMDISDGLSVDLPRLCAASRCGAEIDAGNLPLFESARRWGADPLELGLHGGEDFELLFAVRMDAARRLERLYPDSLPPIRRIGRLTGTGRVLIRHPGRPPAPLPPLGFTHFRDAHHFSRAPRSARAARQRNR
jgi:thiamine-monophosphate kinase